MDRDYVNYYKDCLDKIQAVYSIFSDFHGEDNTDLQIQCNGKIFRSISDPELLGKLVDLGNRSDEIFFLAVIFVFYPEVIITNEQGDSHTIRELFVKIPVNITGHLYIKPEFIRSRYHIYEVAADYMHSHVSGILVPMEGVGWKPACFGSGPILSSFAILRDTFHDFDINAWRLFSVQLDQFVHVESLAGTPYRKIISVRNMEGLHSPLKPIQYTPHNVGSLRQILGPLIPVFSGFIFCLLNDFPRIRQPFCFINGHYMWAGNFEETILNISNLFISWINNMDFPFNMEDAISRHLLIRCTIDGDSFVSDTVTNSSNCNDKKCALESTGNMFPFKDRSVKVQVDTNISLSSTAPTIVLLNPLIIGYIISTIESNINNYYGNAFRRDQELSLYV